MRIAHHRSWRMQVFFFIVGIATVAEGLVMVLSLGFIAVDWRADILFNDTLTDWSYR